MGLRTAWGLSILLAGFFFFLFGILVLEGMPAVFGSKMLWPGYWDFRSGQFQALSMLYGTMVVASLSILIALPLAMSSALFLSEFSNRRVRIFLKTAVELLAAIPSVVYGLLGVAFLLPWISPYVFALGGITGDSLLAATILLAVMVLPTLITFADDALRCVSKNTREEGLSLGLSRLQVTFSLVIPQAKSGLLAALILAYGRAMGETIAIFMVIGRMDIPFNRDSLSFESLISAGQTLTTKLAGAELSIAYANEAHWQALMALGVILWTSITLISWLGKRLMR